MVLTSKIIRALAIASSINASPLCNADETLQQRHLIGGIIGGVQDIIGGVIGVGGDIISAIDNDLTCISDVIFGGNVSDDESKLITAVLLANGFYNQKVSGSDKSVQAFIQKILKENPGLLNNIISDLGLGLKTNAGAVENEAEVLVKFIEALLQVLVEKAEDIAHNPNAEAIISDLVKGILQGAGITVETVGDKLHIIGDLLIADYKWLCQVLWHLLNGVEGITQCITADIINLSPIYGILDGILKIVCPKEAKTLPSSVAPTSPASSGASTATASPSSQTSTAASSAPASSGAVSSGVFSSGVFSSGVFSSGVVSSGAASSSPVSSGAVSSGAVSSGLVSSGVASSSPVSLGAVSSGAVSSGAASSSPVSSRATSSSAASSGNGSGIKTETDISTTLVTITSCSTNKCSTTAKETGITTVTDVDTTYTTFCPLSGKSSIVTESSNEPVSALSSNIPETKTEISNTVITVTSCENNKCSKVPHITGIITVTDIDTTYTTYCPLTVPSEAPASGHGSPDSVAPASGHGSPDSVAPASAVESLSTSVATQGETSSTADITTYEGKGNVVVASFGSFVAGVVLLFL